MGTQAGDMFIAAPWHLWAALGTSLGGWCIYRIHSQCHLSISRFRVRIEYWRPHTNIPDGTMSRKRVERLQGLGTGVVALLALALTSSRHCLITTLDRWRPIPFAIGGWERRKPKSPTGE